MRGGSSKTRIETWTDKRIKYGNQVWEEVPVKQGLKQKFDIYRIVEDDVWEEVPVKQGLKPKYAFAIQIQGYGMRGGSSKTRIETSIGGKKDSIISKYERRFQ